jgi:hypothetical protein
MANYIHDCTYSFRITIHNYTYVGAVGRCVRAYIHAYMHAYIHAYIHVYACIYQYKYILWFYTLIYVSLACHQYDE